MARKQNICLLLTLSFLMVGCPPQDGVTTYETIKSAKALLYSFDEFGNYPYLDEFNPEELGIAVYPDSIFTREELTSSFSFGSSAYARSDPNRTVYVNAIDSLNFFTVYDFDENHLAGSNINDILLVLDTFGETTKFNVNDLVSTYHTLKFAVQPKGDSLKFRVTGRITEESTFVKETKLVVIQ